MENFGAKNNVPDALFGTTFEDLLHSQWGYRGWKNRPDFHKSRININPKSGSSTSPAYGSSVLFEIPKRAAVLRRLSVRWKTAALATAGTEPRFVDYAGFAALKNSILRYGSNTIHEIKPLELYITNRLDHRRKDQEAIAHLAGGDLPATGLGIDSRENRATGIQQWTVHLPFHFSETPDKCIFTESLGNPLEIEIQLEEFNNLVDITTGSSVTGGGITDFHLVAEFVHVENYERDFHIMRTISPDGLIMAVRQHSYQPRAAITSGQRQFTYPLTNLKQACYEFRFVIRSTTNVDGQLTGTKDYFNFLTLARGAVGDEYWQLKSGDINITDPMNEQWNIYVENRDTHSGDSGDLIYGQSFTYHPEDRRNCTGHITWAGYHNPELLLDAGANFPANLIVDGISREYNAVHQIQGEYTKIFK